MIALKQIRNFCVLCSMTIGIAGLVAPIPVAAVSAINDYTLKPELIARNLNPEGTYSGSFLVTNESLHTLTLKLSVDSEHNEWVKLENDTLVMQDGEAKTVKFAISVPKDAPIGAYFPEIKFAEVDATSPKQGQPFRLALNVFSTPPKDSLEVKELSVTSVTTGVSFNVTYVIYNPSELFVIPSGKLQLVDPLGKPQQSLVINKSGEVLKPHSSTTVQTSLYLPEGASAGKYSITMQVLDKQFGLGQTKQADAIYVPTSFVVSMVTIPILGICGWLVWSRRRKVARSPQLPSFTPRLG